jgi:AP-1 complex subunit sigma 1/2
VGSEKKLYKSIESSLEAQHQSLIHLSASLSPPQAEALAESLNLSRSSPFGPLSQISNRRTFAYLIATLNASHPDYDFSHILRPSDFRKERTLRAVMTTIDTTLHNLRPRQNGMLSIPNGWTPGNIPAGIRTPGGGEAWGLRMWSLIDREMTLRDCEIYCYKPEEDPFDGEEGAIWNLNYFFFNKIRKRVCYLYLRGLSAMSHSPVVTLLKTPPTKRKSHASASVDLGITPGARKRAKYWLGERADADDLEGGYGEDDDDIVIRDPGDDEVDADEPMPQGFHWTSPPIYISDEDEEEDREDDDYEDDLDIRREREKSAVRAMSEQIADSMEV